MVEAGAFGVHVDERGGDEDVVAETEGEGLLVGLGAGTEVGERGAGLDGAGERGAVRVQRQLPH